MAKIRVHELAKELDIPSKQLVEKLRAMGLDVKNHMSTLESEQAGFVRRRLQEGKPEAVKAAEGRGAERPPARTVARQPQEAAPGERPPAPPAEARRREERPPVTPAQPEARPQAEGPRPPRQEEGARPPAAREPERVAQGRPGTPGVRPGMPPGRPEGQRPPGA
ncbi:MAG: translation initiation factor IF-2 N-terminal domain-containing protein, partial [Syntrophomonadaceae bacterium]|nr:translation initiation factor IF-2 N-terminal domain-containing protein [Syntrophomonadaceae bacterium]